MKLRAKLGADLDLTETIRGFGYRLRAVDGTCNTAVTEHAPARYACALS
jgi:hypothetical protein